MPQLNKAQIASRAQAAAHRALRDAHPDEYQHAYRDAKQRLEAENENDND